MHDEANYRCDIATNPETQRRVFGSPPRPPEQHFVEWAIVALGFIIIAVAAWGARELFTFMWAFTWGKLVIAALSAIFWLWVVLSVSFIRRRGCA